MIDHAYEADRLKTFATTVIRNVSQHLHIEHKKQDKQKQKTNFLQQIEDAELLEKMVKETLDYFDRYMSASDLSLYVVKLGYKPKNIEIFSKAVIEILHNLPDVDVVTQNGVRKYRSKSL